MFKKTPFLSIMLLVLPCLLGGCGGGESDGKSMVTGEVTWNGAPIKKGKIVFATSSGGMDAGDIENGKYSVRTDVGEKTVSITAEKSAGYTIKVERVETPEEVMYQYIPHEFNNSTSLKETVSEASKEINISLKGEEIPAPKKK